MPSGTSGVGIQLLQTNIDWQRRGFLIIVSGVIAAPPRRLGYFWAEVADVSTGRGNYIVDQGVLFFPGVRKVIPNSGFGSGEFIRHWVDWNWAGLDWELVTYIV